jgi:hypothetical protein
MTGRAIAVKPEFSNRDPINADPHYLTVGEALLNRGGVSKSSILSIGEPRGPNAYSFQVNF